MACLVAAGCTATHGATAEPTAAVVAVSSPPEKELANDSGVRLWLSAKRVRPGAELVGALVSTGPTATFGVAASIDRWDGARWARHRQLHMCLLGWGCSGKPEPLETDMTVLAIGLNVTLSKPGAMVYFSLGDLGPGWYRVSQKANEGIVAVGVVEVADDAPLTPPSAPSQSPGIAVDPPLLPRRGQTVELHPLVLAARSLDELNAALVGLFETASLQRWNGSAWEPEMQVQLSPGRSGADTDRSLVMPTRCCHSSGPSSIGWWPTASPTTNWRSPPAI